MTRMHNPPHPGAVLRDGVFTDTGITVTGFAKRLGVTRVAFPRAEQQGRHQRGQGCAACRGARWQCRIMAAHAGKL